MYKNNMLVRESDGLFVMEQSDNNQLYQCKICKMLNW
jgi:hypothetical protein